MPSAEVNSVMIRPHPPRFRMKRRKTVSVTPAMGARTVAGEMVTAPNRTDSGTGICSARAGTPAPISLELSQNFRTNLFYASEQDKAPLHVGAKNPCWSVPNQGRGTYFLAVSALAYLRRNLSTRPAVSTSFCLPVKNGWQFEQISTWMSPLWVDRVANLCPQAQMTLTSL